MDTITNLTGITASQIKNIIVLVFSGMIFFGAGEKFFTIAVGVAYPTFMSFMALESVDENDDKQWLTYWIVFGAFNILDHFADVITAFIPFYLLFKVIFFVYLMHPWTQGATTVYNMLILPNVKKYETKLNAIDSKI